MEALLVVNPRAGRVGGEAGVSALEARLRGAGLDVQRLPSAGPQQAATALASALAGASPAETRVVVAGGDGTINSCLPALIGTDFALGLLPVGSVNVLSRELGLPRHLDAAIDVIARGSPRRIDLGLAEGRPFALMAGLGFDAEVVGGVLQEVKNVVGSFAYVARGLQLLASYPRSRFRIGLDDGAIEAEAWLAVVANAGHYTYRWKLSPEARIDDGWLDLCLFCAESPAQAVSQAAAALAGRHASHPGVRHLRGKSFAFECDPSVAVQLDGDAVGRTPVQITLAHRALSVLVPPAVPPA